MNSATTNQSHRAIARRTPYVAAALIGSAAGWILLFFWTGIARSRDVPKANIPDDAPPSQRSLIAVAPPPFSDGIFPCSECHDGSYVDTTRRVVEEHDIVFEHDPDNRWCLDCHDATNRDKLRLADGRLLDFTESHLLCGQCHGPTLRDWKQGAHGKRTGSWSGAKEYLLCVHCHDPHSPRVKPMPPLPPPNPPETVR